MNTRRLLAPAGGSAARTVAVSVVAPAVALGIGLLVHPEREVGAVSLFLLAVVAAAVIGGIGAGIGSSVLGFLALNWFFTEPLHTFRVYNRDDVVTIVTFLIVALVVGSVVARAVQEGVRATRREREARLLNLFATKALSGQPLEQVLNDLAAALIDALRLSTCAIVAQVGIRRFEIRRAAPAAGPSGSSTTVEIPSGGGSYGVLTAARPDEGEALSSEDARLLESAARQLAVIFDREALDERVRVARIDAEESQARAALFASVTHDLRTPLASIKASVTTLLQDELELDAEQRLELLRTVVEETDRLNRLIGNILELARVRAGALVPSKEPTALDEVVESVLHRMQPALAAFHVRTMLRDAPEVAADPVQIDQVVSNLVENAARFSSPGGEIVVSVAPWHASVQVRVVDHGPGIAPVDRDRVFEAFARVARSDREETGGSGLGLTIAKAIVLAHGGRIWIEGVPGGGTAVSFELPVSDTEPVLGRPRP
jgi:two-component system, OmpR family, sensor histidine kinase KdpD